jgi:hypothetical protein
MNMSKFAIAILFIALSLGACKKDQSVEGDKTLPKTDNIEVGTANNETGVIGRDFHFNAEIIAGYRIDVVQIKITPRAGATYSRPWDYTVEWSEYKGAKNATIHKHFDIPTTAAEGIYDFLIIVKDENGSVLEVKKTIRIYDPANLPVDTTLSVLNLHIGGTPYYRYGAFVTAGLKLKKNDVFSAQAAIENVIGNGKLYLLMINKKENYRPESIDNIDFSKVIVYDVYEHKDWPSAGSFSNFVFDLATFQTVRNIPNLSIGAAIDNNAPTPNPITGTKSWASGDYYFVVLYKNQTYNLSLYQYLELGIDFN